MFREQDTSSQGLNPRAFQGQTLAGGHDLNPSLRWRHAGLRAEILRRSAYGGHFLHVKVWFILFLLVARVAWAEENRTRAWRLTEINAKIADLQKQLEYWQEKKRALLDVPDAPPEALKKDGRTVHTGPRNGKYHIGASGKRVYERK